MVHCMWRLVWAIVGCRHCLPDNSVAKLALQHKSELQVYRELKWKIGFEKCLEYIKGAPSRLFLKFCSGTHGLFEELGRHDKGGGLQECPNCGACNYSFSSVAKLLCYSCKWKEAVFINIVFPTTCSLCDCALCNYKLRWWWRSVAIILMVWWCCNAAPHKLAFQ